MGGRGEGRGVGGPRAGSGRGARALRRRGAGAVLGIAGLFLGAAVLGLLGEARAQGAFQEYTGSYRDVRSHCQPLPNLTPRRRPPPPLCIRRAYQLLRKHLVPTAGHFQRLTRNAPGGVLYAEQ